MKIRDRIKEFRRVPASELRPHPRNWRTHPQHQADALRGVLSEIGMADAVIARELPDGTLQLIDGHLRVETMGSATVPVLVLDVNELEADKLLVTIDPLASLANRDDALLADLLETVTTESDALQAMLDGLVVSDVVDNVDIVAPNEFKEFDDMMQTDHTCPKCGFEWR